MSQNFKQIGFIGLGVMGEPMCRNLAIKSGLKVIAFDRDPAPLARIGINGVQNGGSTRGVATGADVIFLSLPSGEVVSEVAHGPDGLLAATTAGQIVVDLSTSPVDTTRDLAHEFAAKDVVFIDAPVARTRAAAEAGTLSVMVGGDAAVFETVRPLLATFANDITLCGPVGCGQVVKILNNMILFEIGVAVAEAKAIGTHAGVDPAVLFATLAKGSGDSFALRNHGMKAMLPDQFPLRAFSVHYARKDLGYALRLARDAGVAADGARNVDTWFAKAIEAGLGEQYWPVISRLMGK